MKLADTKNRAMPGQLPAALVPISIPVPAGYPHPAKNQVATTTPLTYASYHQPLSAPPASYPNVPTQYLPQPHISYPPLTTRKEPFGLPAALPAGLAGYPYYRTKR